MRQQVKTSLVNKSSSLSLLLCASAAFVLVQASNANANPSGAQVAAGSVSLSTPSVGNLVVNQATDKAIINWQSFDIQNGESTQFVQPSSNSVALNRITNGNPTQILGSLSANGNLMVVNPNGVFFGANSRVDVAGLTVSSADTTDSDFLAGKINLSIAGNKDAAIINQGNITAADGGLVALVAPSVRNDGVIQANMGTVALASADTASVDFYGDNLYSFALGQEATSAASGVNNTGIVAVGAGKVLMSAKVAKGVVDNVINTTGIIEASSAHMEGGTIVLDGGDGNVKVAGKLNASGTKGGSVTVTGENITVAAADIDASGKNAGGTVKIGGDYQGGGTLKKAKTVTVDAASKIDVSAKDTGNGGTAIVWSDEATRFNGSVVGTGGVNGGNGGLAEVSSKGQLGFDGTANLSATNGNAGTLLLDPGSLFLVNFADTVFAGDFFVNVAPLVASLQGGTDVIAFATNNITLLADLIWSGAGSLTLDAVNNVIVEANIKSSFNGTSSQGAVTLNAGNSVQNGNSDISTVGGDITINTDKIKLSNSTLKSTLGSVIINNTGKFSSSTSNSLSGQSVVFNQSADGSIQNALSAIGATGAGGATLNLGTGTWNEDFYVNDSNVTIQGQGSANTKINAAYGFSTVAFVDGVDNVTISDLSINGGTNGVYAENANGFKLVDTVISGASDTGVKLYNTFDAQVSGNYILGNNIGINGEKTTLTNVIGNGFDSNNTALSFTDGLWLTAKFNGVYGTTNTGFYLNNVSESPITLNQFIGTDDAIKIFGGSSVVVSSNNFSDVFNGVYALDSIGLLVSSNNFTNEFTGGDAIHNDGGVNPTIVNNTIDNFTNGIVVLGTDKSSILSNNISNISNDGIYVGPLFSEVINDSEEDFFAPFFISTTNSNNSLIYNNNVSNAFAGIVVEGVDQATVSTNTITNSGYAGILADSVIGLNIFSNNIDNASVGSYVRFSDDVQFGGNIINNTFTGAEFDYSNGLVSNDNRITNNFYGTYLYNSDNATLTGDIFTNNVVGITVDGSENAFIDGVTIDTAAAGGFDETIGINIISTGDIVDNFESESFSKLVFFAPSGPSNAVVRGTTITGGDVGVVVDGEQSSMQFASNTSSFNTMGKYFILRNNAMFASGSLAQADSLDASQQIFDGTRASDFTEAQLAAAEFITTDVEDGIPTIGNVFYKLFPVQPPVIIPPVVPAPTALNLFGTDANQIDDFQLRGLFSYSGRTITNDPGFTPPAFDINALNLSLLAPAAGGVTPPSGPQGLANLEPAAGGNNQQNLAALEPAAGGEASCGNSFLGAGFNSNSFDIASCAVRQQ